MGKHVDPGDLIEHHRARREIDGQDPAQKAAESAGCDAFILKPGVDEVVAALTVLLVERPRLMEFPADAG
jgi:hypothetical protein